MTNAALLTRKALVKGKHHKVTCNEVCEKIFGVHLAGNSSLFKTGERAEKCRYIKPTRHQYSHR
jgi:hypothetical protein